MVNTPTLGWLCPVCHHGVSPNVERCPCRSLPLGVLPLGVLPVPVQPQWPFTVWPTTTAPTNVWPDGSWITSDATFADSFASQQILTPDRVQPVEEYDYE